MNSNIQKYKQYREAGKEVHHKIFESTFKNFSKETVYKLHRYLELSVYDDKLDADENRGYFRYCL